MLIHSVYFWLREDLTSGQSGEFQKLLETLRGIRTVTALYIGKPAAVPPRAVVEQSYTYALTIVFAGLPEHDAYQVDPLHLKFVEQGRPLWTRVQVFDSQT